MTVPPDWFKNRDSIVMRFNDWFYISVHNFREFRTESCNKSTMANLLLFASRQSFHFQEQILRHDLFACLASVPSYGFQIPNNASLDERKFHCVGVYSFPAFAHVHKLSKSTCRRSVMIQNRSKKIGISKFP